MKKMKQMKKPNVKNKLYFQVTKERIRSIRQELSDFNTNVDLKVSILENHLRPELESFKSRSEKLSADLSSEIEILSQQVTSTRTDLTSEVAVNRNQTRILTRVTDKANDLAEEFTKQAEQFSQLLNTVRFFTSTY